MDERRGVSPAIGRSAIGNQEHPRAIIGNAALAIDLLPGIEHLKTLLDSCAHWSIAGGLEMRRRPNVWALEIALDA
ncbi:MAG: hypothetical protein DMG81_16095, partial [Acidobacteria bacterium]